MRTPVLFCAILCCGRYTVTRDPLIRLQQPRGRWNRCLCMLSGLWRFGSLESGWHDHVRTFLRFFPFSILVSFGCYASMAKLVLAWYFVCEIRTAMHLLPSCAP